MTTHPPSLTGSYLAEGALLALEQAGFLMADAATLHRHGSYATAIALVHFGREELGRSRILHEQRTRVARGEIVSLADVRTACEDHLSKQRKSRSGSVTFQPSPKEGLGKAILSKLHSRPDSEEYQEADDVIVLAAKHKLRQLPESSHEERIEALYVDPDDSGTNWNRPRDILCERSRVALNEFLNDYAVEYRRLGRDEPTLLSLVPRLLSPEAGLVDPCPGAA
ncbi:MAG: AbiV family abortive infection protein [Pyrinomonadaceae bacterium]